jgi:ABC-type branched-subunit amino acid transport system substrate-binding protein
MISLGDYASYGKPFRDGVQLAVEEANRAGGTPIALDILDDGGTDDGARKIATRLAASDALAVVGPMLSTASLAAGPIFAEAGLVSIVSAVESDLVTRNATTFHANFKNSEIGDWLADYAHYALGRTHAAVIYVDNGYGRTIAEGFKRGAAQRGIEATFYPFTTPGERDEAGRKAAATPGKAAIILGTLDADAAALVTAWRRRGVDLPVLGGTGLADEAFAGLFKNLPEERQSRGFFTKNVYAAAPVILDSANARTLDFAERFEARFGQRETAMWIAVQGYDAGRLAVAALRAAAAQRGATTVRAQREAVYAYLKSLDGPSHAVPGLLGPIWFTAERGRPLPVRIGRFEKGLFESAPIQLVPVDNPAPEEVANGTLIEVEPGRYARRQQVVYTGIYLNELSRIDIAQSTFTADFYVWVRFATGIGGPGSDPTRFEFPDMVRGRFDRSQPASQRDLDDGTTYRLWRVGGDFKNDYDLRRYPADHQTLNIRFFNAGASSDRLVYVVDRSSLDPAIGAGDRSAARGAFRNLTQWERLRLSQGRENLVTESSVGDPTLAGSERSRELSGFALEIEVKRHIGTTLIKTLLPLGLMTLIMFATLFFPPAMAVAKVTVAITAGLSGAVLLAAINGQLGNVGYVIAVEYGFFVFFALCLTCIVTVLLAERNRIAGRSTRAIENTGRAIFLVGFLGTVIAALVTFG